MFRILPALLVTALIAVPVLAYGQATTPGTAGNPPAPPAPLSSVTGTGPVQSKPGPAPSAAQSAQRDRMTTCNGAAGERNLKGAARQSYMSACLAGKTTPPIMMKVCNAQASQDKMSADDRRSYLTTCLKTSS
ncbi:MAG: hypothetical protein JOZ42_04955 [Acetobacteraceae bacterium]|nr:hypothetical protein [Acetobacteraceae bacterium]